MAGEKIRLFIGHRYATFRQFQLPTEDVLLIDFHVHSTYTEDSPNTISDIVSKVADSGLDGFCLTDIHTMAGMDEAKQAASRAGLVALVGMEAMTDKGHFLVFVPNPRELPDISDWVEMDEQGIIPIQSLVDGVKSCSGILIAAHPYDRKTKQSSGDGIIQVNGLAGLEVANARRSMNVNHMAEEVAAGMGLAGVAGSDARKDLGQIGSVATLVRGSVDTEKDLIEKVLSFDVWPVFIGKQPIRQTPPRRRQSSGRNSRPKRSSGRSRGNTRSKDGHGKKAGGRRDRGKTKP